MYGFLYGWVQKSFGHPESMIFQHSEEASSSGLPEISSPVAVVSSDQEKHQVDPSAPLVDDSFGGARPKTFLSTSSSETSSPVCIFI